MKEIKRGWVEIPVGDFKPSHLNDHLDLKVIGAPEIQFVQTEVKDLCVTKSLASAFLHWGGMMQLPRLMRLEKTF